MKFSLIGYPLGHSVSPFIHSELFKLSGINATYVNTEIPTDKLDIKSIMNDFDGINVTIPHKTAVIPFLDELCDKAAYLCSVNTIKKHNGKLLGYNTDANGFLKSLEMSNISLSGNVLVCGAGGTSRMMSTVAAKMGCNVTISSRSGSIDKAIALAKDIESKFNCKINVADSSNINGDFDLLLNGTPAGMYPKNIDLLPVNIEAINNCKAVFDAVYNPELTKLIRIAKSNGAKTALGMPMLVYQAAAAQKIWLNSDFNENDLLSLIEKTNTYLNQAF